MTYIHISDVGCPKWRGKINCIVTSQNKQKGFVLHYYHFASRHWSHWESFSFLWQLKSQNDLCFYLRWECPKFQSTIFKPNVICVYISDVECPKCRGNILSYGNCTKQTKVLPFTVFIMIGDIECPKFQGTIFEQNMTKYDQRLYPRFGMSQMTR